MSMRIAKQLLSASCLLLSGISLHAQTTWSEHVAPILYNNCVTCHRPAGIAPFELLSFNSAMVNGNSINAQVQSNQMPPWPPDASYARLAHERILSASDKATIANWVAGGKLQGNVALAPPAPVFNPNGDLPGVPSLTLQIPTFSSTATATDDEYRCFVISTGQSANKFITAFEAIPGNRSIVHHVLVYADTTGQSTALDAADPGPGYTSFGGIGVNDAILLGGWVPGSAPIKFPAGFGAKLPASAKIVVQIHYPSGTTGMVDSTKINFFFSPTSSLREVFIAPVLNHAMNITPALSIPPNTIKHFTENYIVPNGLNATLIGIAPHMHLIGKSIEAYGVLGTDTTRYISVPDWDFHWQGFYMLSKLKKIAQGTEVIGKATYDNTTNNPHNPSNPAQMVVAGERTTDEMMLVYFVFALYQAGDENIIVDSSAVTGVIPVPYYKGQQMLQPYPIPASNELITKYFFDKPGNGTLELIGMNGQLVHRFFENKPIGAGYTTIPVSVSQLASGVYTLRLRTATGTQAQQIILKQ